MLWINDSKATNPHAASASLASFSSVVWIAGGLSKGVNYDELIADHARRLKAVVLIGTDNSALLASLQRHAPDVPVIGVPPEETEDRIPTSGVPRRRDRDGGGRAGCSRRPPTETPS